MKLFRKLRALFRKDTLDREMSEEMRHHLELQVAENIAAGMNPNEARYAALRSFGGVEQIKERARDQRAWVWLEQTRRDVAYGTRQLIRSPGFTIISILTIALGIGACTALFSVANKMLLDPLDYDQPRQYVLFWETSPTVARMPTTPGNFHAWQMQTTAFSDIVAMSSDSVRLDRGDRFFSVPRHFVSANFTRMTRIRPDLGRDFTADEFVDGKDHVILLSRALWLYQFGGRTDIVGEVIHLDDGAFTVVGVIHDPLLGGNYIVQPSVLSTHRDDFTTHGVWAQGRLKPGRTIEQAQMELDVVAARVAAEHPNLYKGHGVGVQRFVDFGFNILGTMIELLLGATGLLLLIACVNVASLSLARATARQREIAVRMALGAQRSRIVRQLLSESLLLAFLGGILGTGLAWALMNPLAAFASTAMPRTDRIAIDGWVLFGSFGLILLTSVGIGLIPALQATKGNLVDTLKDGGQAIAGGRTQRTRHGLVTLQVAVACVLLVNTGLLARSLQAHREADLGVTVSQVYELYVTLDSRRLYDTPEKIAVFARSVLERIEALPGVMSASIAEGLHSRGRARDGFILEGQRPPAGSADAVTMTELYRVTPDYFKTLGIPLFAGREFTSRDAGGATPVALINQEMARRHFAGQNPVGRRIQVLTDKTKAWSEIVGIVGDVRSGGAGDTIQPQLYRPLAQSPVQTLGLIVKVTEYSPALASAVKEAFLARDSALPVTPLGPYRVHDTNWSHLNFNFTLFGLFSGCALLLAAIGIYGVTAYSVVQRTREIGIRMALGALPHDVARLILTGSLKVVLVGLLVGVGAGAATTRLMSSLLYSTSPHDPWTFVLVAAGILLVALLACWLPARRAAKVDPMVALRCE